MESIAKLDISLDFGLKAFGESNVSSIIHIRSFLLIFYDENRLRCAFVPDPFLDTSALHRVPKLLGCLKITYFGSIKASHSFIGGKETGFGSFNWYQSDYNSRKKYIRKNDRVSVRHGAFWNQVAFPKRSCD
ncbi:unnamed protein product [Brassica oleracea var. botrytis]